jgi:hypothetical protein
MTASAGPFAMRAATLAMLMLSLAACGGGGMSGMARAAQQTGAKFDKYGCLSRELKGEEPCPQAQPVE